MLTDSLCNNNNNRDSNDGRDEFLDKKLISGDTPREINNITIK